MTKENNIVFVKVRSSNIDEVAYNGDSLYVSYKAGNTYKYTSVPREVYNNLLESDSKGRFINSNIKEKYKYMKIDKQTLLESTTK